jgi:hypothetical protein
VARRTSSKRAFLAGGVASRPQAGRPALPTNSEERRTAGRAFTFVIACFRPGATSIAINNRTSDTFCRTFRSRIMRLSMVFPSIAIVLFSFSPTSGQSWWNGQSGPCSERPDRPHCGLLRPHEPTCPNQGRWCGDVARCFTRPRINGCGRGSHCYESCFPVSVYPPISIASPYFTGVWVGWDTATHYYDTEPVQYSYTPAEVPRPLPVARASQDRPSRFSLIVPMCARRPMYELVATQPSANGSFGLSQLEGHAGP